MHQVPNLARPNLIVVHTSLFTLVVGWGDPLTVRRPHEKAQQRPDNVYSLPALKLLPPR